MVISQGEFLRSLRKNSGLSLEQASRGLCSVSYLSLLERGLRKAGPKISSELLARYGVDAGSTTFIDFDSSVMFVRQALVLNDINTAITLSGYIHQDPWRSLAFALVLEGNAKHVESVNALRNLIKADSLSPLANLVAFESIVRQLASSGGQKEALILAEEHLLDSLQKSKYSEELSIRVRGSLASCALEVGKPELVSALVYSEPEKSTSESQVFLLWQKATGLLAARDFDGAYVVFRDAAEVAGDLGLQNIKAKLRLMSTWSGLELPDPNLETISRDLDHVRVEWPAGIDFELEAAFLTISARLHALTESESQLNDALCNLEALAPSLPVVLRLKTMAHASETCALAGLFSKSMTIATSCESQLLSAEPHLDLPEVWGRLANASDIAGQPSEALRYYKYAAGVGRPRVTYSK